MYRKVFIDKYLKQGFDFDEARSEVDFALDALFNYSYKDFMLGKVLEKWQLTKIDRVFDERVMTHKPIQQIIGQAFFYKRKFFVNENTLIPRPETELLVEKVLDLSQNYENPKVLDIGTGTGCIPISLVLENPEILADSVDISANAIEMAQKNALFHNVYNKVKFIKSDLFENLSDKYNIIVSNPPYIPLKDKETLQVEVRDFDPPSALFANDDDGIEFYEKIVENARNYLLPNGYLIFELGINQSGLVKKLFEKNGYSDVEIVQDYNSIERIIFAKTKY